MRKKLKSNDELRGEAVFHRVIERELKQRISRLTFSNRALRGRVNDLEHLLERHGIGRPSPPASPSTDTATSR